jgi:hypothetical protein
VIPAPTSASSPEIHANTIMLVMMAADANTIAIWNAADASSK